MGDIQKTAIVVPCYNESKRLRLDEFENYLTDKTGVTFIFVNDGSTDNTLEIIDQLCNVNPSQILCKSLDKNKGKAEAVRQGFLMAIELGFENIGYWDADLSTPLNLIDRLYDKLENDKITIVIGSRIRILGCDIKRRAWRHYLGRVFATFASLILDLYVYDTQCGAKIFKNSSELRMVFAYPFSVRWIFDVEILARFKIIRKNRGADPIEATALEYPLKNWTHMYGSKIKFSDFIMAAIELAKIILMLNFPIIKEKYMEKFRKKD